MLFRKIQLVEQHDFLECTIATKVFNHDIRRLLDIAKLVQDNGYDWCIAHRDPRKGAGWWQKVMGIEQYFDWDRFLQGDPITAKVHKKSLEFGSIDNVGGGCHRTIALAVAVLSRRVDYRPFDILLHFG